MASISRTVRTTEALRLAGLDTLIWRGLISHRLYAAAPQPGADGLRAFDLDDVIALAIFRELIEHKVMRGYAAAIASDVRTVMRAHPQLDSVSVIKGVDAKGQPRPVVVVTPPPGAVSLFDRLSIAKMRAALEMAFVGLAS